MEHKESTEDARKLTYVVIFMSALVVLVFGVIPLV